MDLLLGLQWGDEGKGKIVDVFTPMYDVVARFQGGPNAGHTLEFDGIRHVLHTIPSGIFHEGTVNVIGGGVAIDPVVLSKEIEKLNPFDIDIYSRLLISRRAHLILPTHRLLDATSEKAKGRNKIGSTLKGIGPTYMDKIGRNGLRVGDIELPNFRGKYSDLVKKHKNLIKFFDVDLDYDLDALEKEWFSAIEYLEKLTFIESEYYINESIKNNKTVLAEGAQGALLDIDFGTYPFVTSSNTTSAGACTGLGVPPSKIGEIYGIFKAYTTRVGSGPFPTELFDQDGRQLAKVGNEFGATTGRARRCGWLDLPILKYSIMVNGVTQLVMMKVDVLSKFKTIRACVYYEYRGKKIDYVPFDITDTENLKPIYKEFDGWDEDLTQIQSVDELPENLNRYIEYIEGEVHTPIKIISLGPDRKQTLYR